WSLDACCLRHIYPSPPRPSAHSFPTRRSSDLSRPASVPSGKSHSSRSPRTGLYTAFALVPSSSTVQYSVTFEASRSRPCTSRSPLAIRSLATDPVGSSAPVAPPCRPAGSNAMTSVLEHIVVAVISVLPRADVPLWVQWFTTQRARFPSRAEDAIRPRRERAGLGRGQE